ncbi:hypothetical protein GCM10027184_17400 [Saccharothrix stipae]
MLDRYATHYNHRRPHQAAKRTRGCAFEARHGVFALPDGPLRTVLSLQDRGERARLAAECGSVAVEWT